MFGERGFFGLEMAEPGDEEFEGGFEFGCDGVRGRHSGRFFLDRRNVTEVVKGSFSAQALMAAAVSEV